MPKAVAVERSPRRWVFLILLLVLTTLLSLLAVWVPILTRYFSPTLEVGQVATQDYLAPETITYDSEVLTEQKRENVVRSVPSVFTAPDPNIARQQLEHLRNTLAYITSVRADAYSSQKEKLDDLSALEDIHLSLETATSLLALSDARWQVVQQEAIVVLEQVMRRTIRPDQVDEARNSLPTLVSLSLPEQQANLVADLATAFVAPNSMFSEALTEAARQKAGKAVTAMQRSFIAGETVVPRGKVMNDADVEALRKLGLAQPKQSWQAPASAAVLVLLMIVFLLLYLRNSPIWARDTRGLAVVVTLFVGFLLSARLLIPGHTLIPYAFPIAAYGLIVTALFGPKLGLIFSLPLAILVAYGLSNALDLTVYYAMSSLFGILTLGRARRLSSFLWAGVAIAISGCAVVLAYRLPLTDWIGLASLGGAALFNGLAAASLTVLLQFILAQFLGMTTPMQLMELTRPDHPLLQQLLHEAPGTYQHSLQVANLAEQAAERIGADTLQTRVGSLYHDIGKTLNPIFFIENQVPGLLNPHDDLDPATSAQTIIRHVPDGLELAHRYRLPRRLVDFIAEHHGTMLTLYQYVQAVTAAGGDESQVQAELFRYPGPRPQSRETAILMLADGSEARVRAEKPKEEDELRELIKGVIDDRVAAGQLDNTDLTFRDLDVILDSFTATLRGIYHPRVKYPQLEPSLDSEPTVPIGPPVGRQTSDVPVGTPVDSTR